MCGITGILSFGAPIDEPSLRAATARLTHRGPEAEGYWISDRRTVAFGHRRLCIIDRSEAAGQPMAYAGRYRIVYNGELYNYLELKSELAAAGHLFRTQSDTEVVLAAWQAWGPGSLERFDGMFAFVLWDEQEGMGYAARDRFGEKPLFYAVEDDRFLFASEMKSLWAAGFPRSVNHHLLYNYLTIGYTANPANGGETFFENIHALPAGSWLRIEPRTGTVTEERYGQIYLETPVQIGESEAVARLTQLLEDSVRKRLRSDVPVGTSLSGGLDSSAIAALCVAAGSPRFTHRCFTAVFEGFEKNEGPQAAAVARALGLEHIPVPIAGPEVPHLMDRVMEHQEEPVHSASVLAQYEVFAAARAHGVTVLLDGQGADELLAGYPKYYKWYWQELYRGRRLNSSGELAAARALGVTDAFGAREKAAALFPDFAAAQWTRQREKGAARHPELHPDFVAAHRKHLYHSLPVQLNLNGALHFNAFVYGLHELLRYADRNSSAHGTEVRLPFVSAELARFLFSLPPGMKIRNGWTKWLLRTALKDRLPESVVWRRNKVGFEPPQRRWMEEPGVQERIRAAREVLVRQGILRKEVLHRPVRPTDANDPHAYDWRYWSASYITAD
jgi:asparagine synthase (glutamine-hydrolysing)